jgi:RND family efflux transporter MFP subunit
MSWSKAIRDVPEVPPHTTGTSGMLKPSIALCVLVAAIALINSECGKAAAQEAQNGSFECLIQPMMVLKVGTPLPALIQEVLVDRGSILKKGQIIARLESGVEQAAFELAKARAKNVASVRSAQAKLEFQNRKVARAQQLRKHESIALSAADEAETSAQVAENDLEEAQVNLKLAELEAQRAGEVLKQRTIRSPIDGVVVERTLGPGEYAYDQSHLVVMAQIDPLKVEAFVPLSEFGKITVGDSAEVYPESPVGGKYVAKVSVVDQVFDAGSGTIGIRLDLPNPDFRLPAGLKCRVHFLGPPAR